MWCTCAEGHFEVSDAMAYSLNSQYRLLKYDADRWYMTVQYFEITWGPQRHYRAGCVAQAQSTLRNEHDGYDAMFGDRY